MSDESRMRDVTPPQSPSWLRFWKGPSSGRFGREKARLKFAGELQWAGIGLLATGALLAAFGIFVGPLVAALLVSQLTVPYFTVSLAFVVAGIAVRALGKTLA